MLNSVKILRYKHELRQINKIITYETLKYL